MKIQFNTDKTVNGDERNVDYFTTYISKELKHYSSHITRIEVHLSDENGIKEGKNDIRCVLEVRLEGRQPIAVKNHADNVESAVSGALDSLNALLANVLERSTSH